MSAVTDHPGSDLQPRVDEDVAANTLAQPSSAGLNKTTNGIGTTDRLIEPVEPTDAELDAREEAEKKRKAKAKAMAPLDIKSEEAFPSLMASAPPPTVASSWANRSKGPAGSNGTAGPASSSSPGLKPVAAGPVNLPGKFSDRIELKSSQLMPPSKLGRPVNAILADVKKKTGAHVTIRTGPMGTVIFEAQGVKKAVQQALREVVDRVGLRQSVQHSIPASVRPHIIGKQGLTIQGITERTKARINLPRQDGSATPADDDDEVIVTIEGNPLSVMLAKKEIDDIVDEKTSTVNLKIRDVPPELYPFLLHSKADDLGPLVAAGNLDVRIPEYLVWTSQAPDQPEVRGGTVTFFTKPEEPIVITGDRAVAHEARRIVEQRAANLASRLSADQLPVERGRHQFIVGPKGISAAEFLAETGCSVIVPPATSDSEFLTLVGPAHRLDSAISKVEDLAARMAVSTVDVARQHGNSHAHAHLLTRYLRSRRAVSRLERTHNTSIVLPDRADGPCSWELYSTDGKSMFRARSDIMGLVSAHPPSRVRAVSVDPFFHAHLRQYLVAKIRAEHGVHVVIPDSESVSEVLLVCESIGPEDEYDFPARPPTGPELAGFDASLGRASQLVEQLVGSFPKIVSRQLDVPARFNKKVVQFFNRAIAKNGQAETESVSPQPVPPIDLAPRLFVAKSESSPGGTMSIRGSETVVDELVEKIGQFIIEEEQDEKERSYTTNFEFPQKFANFLIGRGGENIRKLSEEFDVEIRLTEGRVDLQGPQAKAARAKAHILSQAKKWADETTLVIKVAPQFHRDLIGAKGSQVNKLQDRYNVRINFPRSNGSDEAAEDGAGDGDQKRTRQQAADEIYIKGPSAGANNARSELLDLFRYISDNSNVTTVSVARKLVPTLIGQSGRELDALRMATGAKIDIPGKDSGDADRIDIKLKGTKEQVRAAKAVLEGRSAQFDSSVTKTITVDRAHHKSLIGPEGSTIRAMIKAAGGPEDPRERARMVRFPSVASDDDTITVSGPAEVVSKLVAAIEKQVSRLDGQAVEVLEVAVENHRQLIGREGEVRRRLEAECDVTIDIPRRGTTGPEATQVKISGQPAGVAKCRTRIGELVKSRATVGVDVPRTRHHQVADGGHLFRRLRRELDVVVDLTGQDVPAAPAALERPALTASEIEEPIWKLTKPADSLEEDDSAIVWTIRGADEKVAEAKRIIEAAVAAASSGSGEATGYLFLPDTSVYGLIVGPRGKQISAIRAETGTKIVVPRDAAVGRPIEIVGPVGAVEQAKQIILDLVS